ncbi:MAG: clan aspartic protease, family [Chthonomonadales bacterium]|nr:clan aspartic protease, family [Chthonomonadales bacterium]
MIGQVIAHHARLSIRFRLPGQPDLEIDSVIDTGFIGYLTLPMAAVLAMNLPFIRRMPVNLADNSTITVEVYAATILWNGEEREQEVLATGIHPLIGTLLLEGSELNVQFAEGGLVTVEIL